MVLSKEPPNIFIVCQFQHQYHYPRVKQSQTIISCSHSSCHFSVLIYLQQTAVKLNGKLPDKKVICFKWFPSQYIIIIGLLTVIFC